MSGAVTNPKKVDQWQKTIEDYDARKGSGKTDKKLPVHLTVVVILAVILTLFVFLFASQALLRAVSSGQFLDSESLFETPSEVAQRHFDAFTMQTKETFDRDSYPIIKPDKGSASSEFTAKNGTVYEWQNLFDGTIEKTWQADGKADKNTNKGGNLQFIFDSPQMVSAIGIWPGNQKTREKFFNNSRPHEITFIFEDGDGREIEEDITLTDDPIEQIMVFDEPVEIKRIRMRVMSVYEGEKYSNDMISELAIYGVQE